MGKLTKEEKEKMNQQINDECMPVIIWVPTYATKLKIKALVGKTKCEMKMGNGEIWEARRRYLLLDPSDNAFKQERDNELYRFNPLLVQFLDQGGDISDLEAWDKYRKEHEKQ